MKEKEKNKKSKSTNQQLYKVRIYKDFDFPSFSVDRNNTLEDLTYKSLTEVKENFTLDTNYFNFEIINILPFTLKEENEQTSGNADFDFVIREIALNATQDKYGAMDYEKNPDIFVKVQESSFEVKLYVKPEVEDYYIGQVRKFNDILKNKIVRR